VSPASEQAGKPVEIKNCSVATILWSDPMPTNLPMRSSVQTQSADWAKCGQALLTFYVSAALALLLLVAVEARLGMFDGLNVMESIVKATGIQSRNDGMDPNWASAPPF
jgi:hypothetical protein